MRRERAILTGILAGAGALALGLALAYAVGPIPLEALAWPVNGYVAAAFVCALAITHALRRRVRFFRWLSGYGCAIGAIAWAVVATIVQGLVNAAPSWWLATVYAWVALSLGMTILRVGSRRWTWRTVTFMLNHAGLLIVLVCATLGSADLVRVNMLVGLESLGFAPQTIAYDPEEYLTRDIDVAIALRGIDVDYYATADDMRQEGTFYGGAPVERLPRSIVSHISIYKRQSGGLVPAGEASVAVNHPASAGAWRIYQHGYDQSHAEPEYSVLQLVRDPWLPGVYVGVAMLLIGALTLFLMPKRKES